jgi:hypothetical protein
LGSIRLADAFGELGSPFVEVRAVPRALRPAGQFLGGDLRAGERLGLAQPVGNLGRGALRAFPGANSAARSPAR